MEEAAVANYAGDASPENAESSRILDDGIEVWSFASGMLSQLRSNVGDFVHSVSEENKDVVDEFRQKSNEVVSSVKKTVSTTIAHAAASQATETESTAATEEDNVNSSAEPEILLPAALTNTLEAIGGQFESFALNQVAPSVQSLGGKAWAHAFGLFSSNDAASPERQVAPSSPGKHVLTAGAGLAERLNVLRSDLNTYISDVVDPDSDLRERLDAFRKKFILDEEQCRCNEELMQESALVKSFFNELVPSRVSEVEFWTRYWFRERELRRADSLREAFVARDPEEAIDLSWGDEGVDESEESKQVAEHSETLEDNHSLMSEECESENWTKVDAAVEAADQTLEAETATEAQNDITAEANEDDEDWDDWE